MPGDEESKHAQHELERFYSARPSITPDDEALAAEVELTPHADALAAPEAAPELTPHMGAPEKEALAAEVELTPHSGTHAAPGAMAETAPEVAPEGVLAMEPDQAGLARETTQMLPATVSDQFPHGIFRYPF